MVWTNPTTLVAVIVILVTLAVVGLVGLAAGRRPTYAVAGDRRSRPAAPCPSGEHPGE